VFAQGLTHETHSSEGGMDDHIKRLALEKAEPALAAFRARLGRLRDEGATDECVEAMLSAVEANHQDLPPDALELIMEALRSAALKR
jgi:hypothetical protein